MRLHRFMGNFDLQGNLIEIKDQELVNQISKVLRLKQGNQFILSDEQLNEALTEITEINKNKIRIKVIKKYKNENEPEKKITLYCSILKRENFELVVQKATETGISEIVPLITERTVKTGLNMERLRKIIKEAAEQSGRGIVPLLREPVNFIETVKNGGIIFDISGEALFQKMPGENLNIFIGPEGGWSESELRLAKENNIEIVSLGKLTLRAETAAIIASYLLTKKKAPN